MALSVSRFQLPQALLKLSRFILFAAENGGTQQGRHQSSVLSPLVSEGAEPVIGFGGALQVEQQLGFEDRAVETQRGEFRRAL